MKDGNALDPAWANFFNNPPEFREREKEEKPPRQTTLDSFFNPDAPPVVTNGTQFWFIPESTGKGWFVGEYSSLSEGFVKDAGKYGWLIRQYSDGVKLTEDRVSNGNRTKNVQKVFLIKKVGEYVVIQRAH